MNTSKMRARLEAKYSTWEYGTTISCKRKRHKDSSVYYWSTSVLKVLPGTFEIRSSQPWNFCLCVHYGEIIHIEESWRDYYHFASQLLSVGGLKGQ